MVKVYFKEKLFCVGDNVGRRICDEWGYIDLYYGLVDRLDRHFVQNCPPHWFGLLRTGQIGNLHPPKCQKQRDHQDYEMYPSIMSCKHTHGGNLTDSLIHCKLVESTFLG